MGWCSSSRVGIGLEPRANPIPTLLSNGDTIANLAHRLQTVSGVTMVGDEAQSFPVASEVRERRGEHQLWEERDEQDHWY